MTYNLRTSVLRMDTSIPLGPNKLLIEFRGLGLKSDTPEQRAERVRDHNTIWGPFGRNLHEDLLAVHGQGRAMRPGSEADLDPARPRGEHDDPRRRRHAALLRRMEPAHGARGFRPARRPAMSRRSPERPPRGTSDLCTPESWKASSPMQPDQNRDRRARLSLVPRARRKGLQGLPRPVPRRLSATRSSAHSPEIRKDMIWLDHDKPGMQLLFNNLPRHISDHSPLSRHAIVYTVELAATGNRPHVVSALQVFKTTLDGGATELFAIGRYLDTVSLDGGAPRLLKRVVRLDDPPVRLRLSHSVLSGGFGAHSAQRPQSRLSLRGGPGRAHPLCGIGRGNQPALRMRQRHVRHLQGAPHRGRNRRPLGRRRPDAST